MRTTPSIRADSGVGRLWSRRLACRSPFSARLRVAAIANTGLPTIKAALRDALVPRLPADRPVPVRQRTRASGSPSRQPGARWHPRGSAGSPYRHSRTASSSLPEWADRERYGAGPPGRSCGAGRRVPDRHVAGPVRDRLRVLEALGAYSPGHALASPLAVPCAHAVRPARPVSRSP